MERKTKQLSEGRWALMDQLFRHAVTLIGVSAMLALSRDLLKRLADPVASLEYAIVVLSLLLFVAVVVLVFRWIFAVQGEMRLLREYFPEGIASQPSHVYVWTIAFSVLLGALASLVDKIGAFCAVFTVYSLGDLWGQYLRNAQLKPFFKDLRANSNKPDEKQQAIEHYFLDMPQMERSGTIMFFSFIALTLSLLQHKHPDKSDWLSIAAYLIMILNIVISEIVISRWRRQRDLVLDEIFSF